MREREAFEAALAADRYDTTTRLVYADWLEEHGEPEAASEQRRCATPAWVEAARWLEDLADRAERTCVNYKEACKNKLPDDRWLWRDITFDDLIEAGYRYVNSNGSLYWTQQGEQELSELTSGPDMSKLYWRHWQIVTGVEIDDGLKRHGDIPAPFSCTC